MIKKRILGAMAVVLLLGFTSVINAQPTPPTTFGGPLYFSFPLLTQYPPLSMGMSYDVLLGYVGFDSLAKHADKNDLETALKNLTYSDTAKYAARFLYQMADYDPVKFFQWLNTSPTTGYYKNAPAYVRRRLTGVFDTIAPKALNAAPLLLADYILHVRVTDTQSSEDTTASLAKSAELVTAYVVDTIKGRRIPFCLNEQFKNQSNVRIQSTLGACINFDYRLEWRRLNHSNVFTTDDSTLVDGSGNTWITKNNDYIVFLRFVSLRRDSQYNYASLIPVTGWGTMACMYPIVNGVVYDPYDDFGFGTGLTPEQFKAALRNNIYTLTHP